MRYLRNYWKNTGWMVRLQMALGLGFLLWVVCLPLLRPMLPVFFGGLVLPVFLPLPLLQKHWLLPVLMIVGVVDATAMDFVDNYTVLWLMMVWIWFSLGFGFGTLSWTLAQEPPEDSSQRAETEGTPEDTSRLNPDIPLN
jgi:hypothetical protein